MKVYILRHAESLSYVGKADFESDPGLSPLGIKQAELIAEKFKNISIERILTSSTKRAVETAHIINSKLGKTVELSDDIREMKPPKLEITDAHKHFLSILDNLGKVESLVNQGGAEPRDESFVEIEVRSMKFLKKLNEYNKDILIITHSTFSRILVMHMLLGTFILPEQIRVLHIDHAGLTTCQKVDNIWRLLTWNDNSHLGEYMSRNTF